MKRKPHKILNLDGQKNLIYEDIEDRKIKIREVPYYTDHYNIDITNLEEIKLDKILYKFNSQNIYQKLGGEVDEFYALFEYYYEFKDEYYIFYNEKNTFTGNISFVRVKSNEYHTLVKDYTVCNFDLLDEI